MPFKHLTEDEKRDTITLLAAIERKDKRFRVAQAVFMIGTFLLLTVVIIAQYNVLNQIKAQNMSAQATADKQSKESNERQEKIIRRLDCVVVFFGQKDRANLSIEDIEKCALNRDGNVDQFFGAPPESTGSSSGIIPPPTTERQTAPRQEPSTSGAPLEDDTPTTPVVTPPEPEDTRSDLGRLPVVGGLLDAIGL